MNGARGAPVDRQPCPVRFPTPAAAAAARGLLYELLVNDHPVAVALKQRVLQSAGDLTSAFDALRALDAGLAALDRPALAARGLVAAGAGAGATTEGDR